MSRGQQDEATIFKQKYCKFFTCVSQWIACDLTAPSNLHPQPSAPLLARAVSSWSATSDVQLNLASGAGDIVTALLSFSQGDLIGVLQQREDWWLGQLNGTQGWFPKSYVTVEAGGSSEYEEHENRRVHTHVLYFRLIINVNCL